MIVRDGEHVRLALAAPVAYATAGFVALLGVPLMALGIAGAVAIATGTGHTGGSGAATLAIGGVLSAAAVIGGLLAVASGARAVRRARRELPVLESTPSEITLRHPGRPTARVGRDAVARATYTYHRPNQLAPFSCARLEWFDGCDRSVAVWTLSPLWRRAVGGWFRAAGVDGTVQPVKVPSAPLPTGAGR